MKTNNKIMIKKIFASDKELSNTNCERSEEADIKNNLFYCYNNISLAVNY